MSCIELLTTAPELQPLYAVPELLRFKLDDNRDCAMDAYQRNKMLWKLRPKMHTYPGTPNPIHPLISDPWKHA